MRLKYAQTLLISLVVFLLAFYPCATAVANTYKCSDTITVAANDHAGYSTTETITAILDTDSPELAISSPVDGLVTNLEEVTVTGTTTDDNLEWVTVNNDTVSVDAGGNFSVVVPLPNEGSNTITAVAKDTDGNSTTVTITVIKDTYAPYFYSTAPYDGFVANQSGVTVSGKVEDENIDYVTVNGSAVTLASGAFSTEVSLVEGSNTITIVACDRAGNSYTEIITPVIIDTAVPNLTISLPGAGLITNKATITVSGTAIDANIHRVTVNGSPADWNWGGDLFTMNFSASVSLSEGSNTITVIAYDRAGHSTTSTVSVEQDITVPNLTVSTESGQVTNQGSITVTGTASDANLDRIEVNGGEASLSSGNFQMTANLDEGSNTITITAYDKAGNSTTSEIVVVRDSIAPILVIEPADGFVTNQDEITVSGSSTDERLDRVTVNGNEVVLTSGAFTSVVGLVDGPNTITVIAYDTAGNSTTGTITVTLDTNPPVLVIAGPVDGLVTNSSAVVVSGTATDDKLNSVTVNEHLVVLMDYGAFSATVALVEGQNTITIEAVNTIGNSTTAVLTVIKDTAVPVLNISSPTTGITNQSTVIVSGTVSDDNLNRVSVNGTDVTVNNGEFSAEVDLSEGSNTIPVTAYDQAGNTTVVEVEIISDTTAPVLALDPADEITNSASLTVSGTATDLNLEEVTVNGEVVTVDSDDEFSTTVNIAEGNNTITVVVNDTAGNSTSESINVTLDTVNPTLVVITPSGLVTNQSEVLIYGTAADENFDSVEIDGVDAVFADGDFSLTVSLLEGINSFDVVAYDLAGNSVTVEIVVTWDDLAPSIDSIIPSEDKTIYSGQSLTISFNSASGGTASFMLSTTGIIPGDSSIPPATDWMPLGEVSDGFYQAVWKIPSGLLVEDGQIFIKVYLDGHKATTFAPAFITITAAPSPGPSPSPVPAPDPVEVIRLSGGDRLETATAISAFGWDSAKLVILARSDDYADALAGAPLAFKESAPILLTQTNTLSAETRAEIVRLGAERVIVLGGENAISDSVVKELEALHCEVERIAGNTRFSTAVAIAEVVAPNGADEVILVYGHNFPDALSVASYAAIRGIPILLTGEDAIPDETKEFLAQLGASKAIVVGGSKVIKDSSLSDLDYYRVSGADRYGTAVALAQYFDVITDKVFIATGLNCADAITGAALAAKLGYAMLLVGNSAPDVVLQFLGKLDVKSLYVLGGESVVRNTIVDQLIK